MFDFKASSYSDVMKCIRDLDKKRVVSQQNKDDYQEVINCVKRITTQNLNRLVNESNFQ